PPPRREGLRGPVGLLLLSGRTEVPIGRGKGGVRSGGSPLSRAGAPRAPVARRPPVGDPCVVGAAAPPLPGGRRPSRPAPERSARRKDLLVADAGNAIQRTAATIPELGGGLERRARARHADRAGRGDSGLDRPVLPEAGSNRPLARLARGRGPRRVGGVRQDL